MSADRAGAQRGGSVPSVGRKRIGTAQQETFTGAVLQGPLLLQREGPARCGRRLEGEFSSLRPLVFRALSVWIVRLAAEPWLVPEPAPARDLLC